MFQLDLPCRKAAANVAATQPVATEQSSTEAGKTTQTSSSSSTGKSTPTSAATPKATTTSVIESQRIKDYRVGIWRSAEKSVIRTRSKESVDILFTLAMTNTLSKVDSSKIRDALGTMTGSPAAKVKGIKESASLANKLDEQQRQKCLTGLVKHLGKTFSSLMSKPKEKFITSLMKSGFSFDEVLPKVMKYPIK
ncbi:hypothetical protein ACO0LF_28810 [Undibacterium sp. Di27W]|uniref:hypothetical protein n=1 Tax=Undibacterium sp. Di27W TaxID=3413036 RepID=UPI003BF0BD1F